MGTYTVCDYRVRGDRVDGHAQRRRSRTGIARHRVGRGQQVRTVRQRCSCIRPGPAAVGRCATQQRHTVVDIHRAVRHRTAGQRQRVVIGDAVAHRATVGRERGDGRGSRWRRNCHRQGCRRRPGIAGRIGRRRGQAVRAIRPAPPS